MRWRFAGGLFQRDRVVTFGINVPGNPRTLTHSWENECAENNIPIINWAEFKAGLDKPTDKPPSPPRRRATASGFWLTSPTARCCMRGTTQIVSNPDFHGDGSHAVPTTDGWSVSRDYYEIIGPSPKIVITTDGRATTARMYEGKRVVKEGKATCSPEDVFDYEKGARLAFDRLMNRPTSSRTW